MMAVAAPLLPSYSETAASILISQPILGASSFFFRKKNWAFQLLCADARN
jgi:hypothetical protein